MSPFHTILLRPLRFPLLVFLLLAAFISTCSLYIPITHSAQVTLQWDPNTEPDLLGYKVYYGSSSRSYQFNNDVGNKTTCTVSNLEDGKAYYFAVTAYDTSGNESNYSGEVVYNPPLSCTYSISLSSQSFSSSAGTGAVSVTAQTGCTWTATANQSWLLITSNSGGTGNGTINYSVSANPNNSSRTGTLTTAGKTFTITQAGLAQYTLTVTKTGTGTGSVATNPSGTTFNMGTVVTLTATPNASSTFSGWSSGCSGTSPTCTVTMNANTTVTATFTLRTYLITATGGAGGSISPQGQVAVNYGANQNFAITPNNGYGIAGVKVDGVSMGGVTSYSFSNVTANHTIEASFVANQYTLSINKTGTGTGTVTNSPTGSAFSAGTVVTLTATADANSTFTGWSGGCTGTSPSCTATMNANTTVTATFTLTLQTYTITASAGTNGSISPQGAVSVNAGASQTFTITPATGCQIADVKADGISAGAVSSYTFGNVRANHTIASTFSLLPSNNPTPGTVVLAVNAGGKQYTDKAGIVYRADKYYSGGRIHRTTKAIAGTEDGPLYQTERYGNFDYAIPVANGNYTITLKFAELYWSSSGKRIFDVRIGGTEVISNLDIFAKVGKCRAYDVSIPVTVTDGKLNISFRSDVSSAKVSAIWVRTR